MAEYSEVTEKLLERMDKVALRQEYVFDKEKIKELVKEVYNFLELKVPKIEWVVDLNDPGLLEAAWATGAARAAWVAGAARAAWAARAAGDYDLDWFIFTYEFSQTNPINDNDRKFLRASELSLQLKESGMGYWAEKDGILYVAPNPIIQLDEKLRYHSTTKPSIAWKNGQELFYLYGVQFEKKLWESLVKESLTAKEIISLKNIEQRQVAVKLYGYNRLLDELKETGFVEPVHTSKKYELFRLTDGKLSYGLLKYTCPSTGRLYISPVPDGFHNADEAAAWKFPSFTLDEFLKLTVES